MAGTSCRISLQELVGVFHKRIANMNWLYRDDIYIAIIEACFISPLHSIRS
jgi:hypothetical protein